MGIRAAVFDMDGTILDTVGDLRDALNHTLAATGHRAGITGEDAKMCFGSGVTVAMRRALALENGAPRSALTAIGGTADGSAYGVTAAEAERLQAVFRPWYAAHCNLRTGPYPGIPAVLAALRARGIRTAVVSNKPDAAVRELAAAHFPGLFDLAVGERAGIRRKPAPDMTEEVLRRLGVTAAEAVYVGDTEIDIETAAAAHLPCVTVTWGFRPRPALEAIAPGPLADDADALLRALTDPA